MVCQECKNRKHDECKNTLAQDPRGTWCDCQHRPYAEVTNVDKT